MSCFRFVAILCILTAFSTLWVCYFVGSKDIRLYGEEQLREYNCSKLEFSPTDLPITALASYPGSGNTWLRYLLQKMTGIATGSVYHDYDLEYNGFPGEGVRNGSVVAIKTHRKYQPSRTHYDRAILLIRSPYEALLAHFRFRMTRNHLGHPRMDKLTDDWKNFIAKFINKYRIFHISWLQHPKLLLVFYENLKSDWSGTLSRIYSFLNTGILRRNIQCCLEEMEGGFHRNHSKSMSLKSYYSKEHILIIDKIILEIHTLLVNAFPGNSFQNMLGWLMK